MDSAETEDSYFDIKGLRNATCYRLAAAARTSVGMGNLSPLTEGFTTCSGECLISSPSCYDIVKRCFLKIFIVSFA